MTTTLAIHTRHDASVALGRDEKLISFVELDKITGIRYFGFSEDPAQFAHEFRALVLPHLPDAEPDEVVLTWVHPEQEAVLREVFSQTPTWKRLNHHLAHAWSAYAFTHRCEHDLIVSYDGGGDLFDTFKVFAWSGGELRLLTDVRINLGLGYRLLGVFSAEIQTHDDVCSYLDMGFPGKVMALACYGKVVDRWIEPLRRYYFRCEFAGEGVIDILRALRDEASLPDTEKLPDDMCRDLLATSQAVFEDFFRQTVYPLLKGSRYRRVILVGGCALNVKANSKVAADTNLPVFVPPCPSDCGTSIGALRWACNDFTPLCDARAGVRALDEDSLDHYIRRWGACPASVCEVARLLADGKIIGVMRGPVEMGPRALGGRSLLANPLVPGTRDRLNQIKERELFRPVAPMVTRAEFLRCFEGCQLSPYMSFAPRVRPEHRNALHEVVHVDGTSRVQTVTSDEGWIYDLLECIGELTGYQILANTSLNRKGRPLINSIAAALTLMRTSGFDALYSGGHVFMQETAPAIGRPACNQRQDQKDD